MPFILTHGAQFSGAVIVKFENNEHLITLTTIDQFGSTGNIPMLGYLPRINRGCLVIPCVPNVRDDLGGLIGVERIIKSRHGALPIRHDFNNRYRVFQGHDRIAGQPGELAGPAVAIRLVAF